MFERTQKINALKKAFDLARQCPRTESSRLSDLDLHGELHDAVIDVGQEKLFELKDEI